MMLSTLERKAIINEKGNKVFRFVFTEEKVDRSDELVKIFGIQTDAYSKNPIVLECHWGEVVARCINLQKTQTQLIGDIEFNQSFADKYPENQEIIDRIEAGYINAVSIGFKPITTNKEFIDDKMIYIYETSELVECSFAKIPMNSGAIRLNELKEDYLNRKAGRVISSSNREKLQTIKKLCDELLADSEIVDVTPIPDTIENEMKRIDKDKLKEILINC